MTLQVWGIWHVFPDLLPNKFVDILIALLKDKVARSLFSLVVFWSTSVNHIVHLSPQGNFCSFLFGVFIIV